MEVCKPILNTGLRGFKVATTKVSDVDGNTGKIIYRGYLLKELAGHNDFTKSLQNLNEKWHNLERSLIKYQETHSKHLQKEIIEESEVCWKATDLTVLTAQLTTESKVGGLSNSTSFLF